jgi:O-succinylbenzoate synthase
MILQKIECREYAIPFVTPLVTAKRIITSRHGLIIRGKSSDGKYGYGEIAPLEGFSPETLDEARNELAITATALTGCEIPSSVVELQELLRTTESMMHRRPSVTFGVETMLTDLASQSAGVSLARWFNPSAARTVPVNALLSGSIDDVIAQLQRKRDRGFRSFKLKFGAESAADELAKIAAIRKFVEATATIRLDANGAFGYDQAVTFLSQTAQYDIEYVEDPLPPNEWHRWRKLRAECNVPLAVDEEAERCLALATPICDVVILKPTIIGGISKTMTLAAEASQRGIRTVVSSTLESGIGLTALVQLSAVLHETILPCGLDTLDLLGDTLIDEQLEIKEGVLQVPDRHGLGVGVSRFDSNPHLTPVIL